MKKRLFTKTDKIVMALAYVARLALVLGGASAYSEGHPYISAGLIAFGMATTELKDMVAKKQNPDG